MYGRGGACMEGEGHVFLWDEAKVVGFTKLF